MFTRRRIILALAATAVVTLAQYLKADPKPAPTMRQATQDMQRRNRKLAEAADAMDVVNEKLRDATLPDLPEEVFAPREGRPL